MRPLFGFLTTLATVTVGTAALEASVISFGSKSQGQGLKPPVTSSATLQRLLELRSKSFTTSALDGSDESSIDFLGRLAGTPGQLFGAPVAEGDLDTITVILEGLDKEVESSIRNEYTNELVTSRFATDSAGDNFIDYLLENRPDGIVSPESKHCSFYNDGNGYIQTNEDFLQFCIPENFGSQKFSRSFDSQLLSQASMGEFWLNTRKGTMVVRISFESKASSAYLHSLKPLFSELHSHSLNGKTATAVVLPYSKARPNSAYSRRSPHVTRAGATTSLARDTQPIVFEQRADIPLSLAPVCYASNSSCNEATNTCSGHGTCYEKSGDCYACRCHDTYVKTESGVEQKVRWGGAACQKRDISSPFFLITGVTIAIMAVVSAAVGMIIRVGNTELPGVIGAGVGPGKTQK